MAVLKKVTRYFQLSERQLTGKRTGRRDERGVALELLYRLGGTSQARIGDLILHGSQPRAKAAA